MASVNSDEVKKWLNRGFRERFEKFQKILNMQGLSCDTDVEVVYNVSMPVASTEMIANLKALREMGAISIESVMDKSELITDSDVEKQRLSGEEKVIKPSENMGNDKGDK